MILPDGIQNKPDFGPKINILLLLVISHLNFCLLMKKLKFRCYIDAAEQQRALNFELVASGQLFSVVLVAYK